jgi:diguanylate cyclase (GGDEF)-like protein
MNKKVLAKRKENILINIYGSSLKISMIALTIVTVLEIVMLGYSIVNSDLYREYLWNYRAFYISLLTVALAYMALNIYVKNDLAHRYKILNYANPFCAVFFFAWSLGITYFDVQLSNFWDPTVFMTFSLFVPLSFYLFPKVYAALIILANVLMIYIAVVAGSGNGPLINLYIFFLVQFVLGSSFQQLRKEVAERMVMERENAEIDVMTGLSNRRFYEDNMKRFTAGPLPENLNYIAIDINGLKYANDNFGHEAGDRLIIGAAECIDQCFGERGTVYRVGGDEFVALVTAKDEELKELFNKFEADMNGWSDVSGIKLSMSYGYVSSAERPGSSITELAKEADGRMYDAKERYYQAKGIVRRR